MNRGLQVILTLAIGLLLGAAGMQSTAQSPRGGGNPAQPEARPAQRGEDVPPLSSFNILLYRHIFDPNRQFDTNYVPPQTNYTPVAPKIALNGVFIDKSEVVAIFEGTSPEYNAAVHVGGIIAGHKLVEIHPDRVLMSINDKPLEMMVADKMIQDLKTKAWQITSDTTPLSGASYSSSGYDDHGSSRYGSDRGGYGDRSSRYGSDRGGYSDRGSYSGSRFGGSDRGSYGDRGSSRYGSDRGGYSDRGGSDRGSYGGSRFGSDQGRSQFGSPSSGPSGSPSTPPSPSVGGAPVPATPGAPAAATPTPAPSSGASQDEIMRRLMERRQKETGQ